MEKLVLKGVIRFLRALFSATKWRKVLSKDWVLKLVSVFLATLLWYYVGGEDVVDKNVMVPVEIINLPRDLVISNQFKKEIEVTVSGPRSLIEEMTNKAVSRQINLSNATPGTNVIENDNKAIPVPRGVTVLRIQPTTIILSLDKLIQKQFSVTPVTSGMVAFGYDLESLIMNPDVITITGPETILSGTDELITELIDIHGLTKSKQVQIPLNLNTSFIELIGQTSVTADITVKPKMSEKKFSEVKVDAYIGGSKRKVIPASVDVIVNIPGLLLQEGTRVEDLFSVNAIENDDDSELLKVSVIPNHDIELPIEVISISPQAVLLVKGSSEKEIDTVEESEVAETLKEDEKVEKQQVEELKETLTKEETGELELHEVRIDQRPTELKILPVKKKIIKTE